MFVSTLSIAIMNVPFGLVGVVMKDNDYGTFETRLTVEIHFFLMYLPGLFSGA